MLDVLHSLPDLLTERGNQHYRFWAGEHIRMGVPEPLARRVAGLRLITDVLEIVRLADEKQCDPMVIGKVYFTLAKTLSFEWVREAIDTLEVDGRWQARARSSLRDGAIRAQRELAGKVRSLDNCHADPAAIDDLLATEAKAFERTQALLTEMRDNQTPDFATLTVAVDEMTKLAGS